MIQACVPDDAQRALIRELAIQHGMRDVRLYGSVARGEADAASDLDLLVGVEPGRSLLDVIAFWQAVEEALETRVDVVTDGGLSPYLRDRIHADAVPL